MALVSLLLLPVLGLAVTSQAAMFEWNFDVPTGAVASPHTYPDTTSTLNITAYGYATQNASPVAPSLGDAWVTGTITSNALYGKQSTPDETGLGLDGLASTHEIVTASFVQLDLFDIISSGATGLTMTVSSIQVGEGFYLWGSNVQGVPGVLIKEGRNPADGGDEQTFPVPLFGTYRYISVSATPPLPGGVSDILIRNGLIATADPCIHLDKTVLPTRAQVSGFVTYTYQVCNCGPVPITVTSFSDDNPAIGDLLDEFIAANGESDVLAVESGVYIHVPYQIMGADPNPLLNCATVTGMPDQGDEVEAESCATVDIDPPFTRRCFLPVTLTEQGWATYSSTTNPYIPGGLLFGKFPIAFAQFKFYGVTYKNKAIIGLPGKYTVTFDTTLFGMTQLSKFFPQLGLGDKLYLNQTNPTKLLNKNGAPIPNTLAGETLALLMNVAYNDMRLMPRMPGYDLEKFTLTKGLFRGKTVGQVLDIANRVLGGASPKQYGLPNPNSAGIAALVDILNAINANYEFVDLNTFIDRGYLKPNVPIGPQGPGHMPTVP